MMDKLSHLQILGKIEELNSNVYDCLLKGDIKAFNRVIDEYESSGVYANLNLGHMAH